MRVVLIGVGGHASDVVDAALRSGWEVAGAYADTEPELDRLGARGVRVLGPISSDVVAPYLLGIGYPKPKRAVYSRLHDARAAGPLLDPSAVVSPTATCEEGVVVLWQAAVSPLVVLRRHCHVGYGATVGHDTVIGEFSAVMPGAQISGNVQIGTAALIGAGSVVLEGLSVGDEATVGAGAVVVDDVSPGTTVIGMPARSRE